MNEQPTLLPSCSKRTCLRSQNSVLCQLPHLQQVTYCCWCWISLQRELDSEVAFRDQQEGIQDTVLTGPVFALRWQQQRKKEMQWLPVFCCLQSKCFCSNSTFPVTGDLNNFWTWYNSRPKQWGNLSLFNVFCPPITRIQNYWNNWLITVNGILQAFFCWIMCALFLQVVPVPFHRVVAHLLFPHCAQIPGRNSTRWIVYYYLVAFAGKIWATYRRA